MSSSRRPRAGVIIPTWNSFASKKGSVALARTAAAAGMRTTLSIRPGNAAQPRDHGHPIVSGFDEIP